MTIGPNSIGIISGISPAAQRGAAPPSLQPADLVDVRCSPPPPPRHSIRDRSTWFGWTIVKVRVCFAPPIRPPPAIAGDTVRSGGGHRAGFSSPRGAAVPRHRAGEVERNVSNLVAHLAQTGSHSDRS